MIMVPECSASALRSSDGTAESSTTTAIGSSTAVATLSPTGTETGSESAIHLPFITKKTTAATRSWSDVNHTKLLFTVAGTTVACVLASQPLYLALARQQCARERLPLRQVATHVWQQHGIAGFFRGSVAAVTGMVIFQVLYYIIVEMGKEYIPLSSKSARDFAAGVAADAVTNPVYIPFSVICSRQMVAGAPGVAELEPYESATKTTRSIIHRGGGYHVLFRGLMLSMALLPLSGLWWFLYEQLKLNTYRRLEASGAATRDGRLFSDWRIAKYLPDTLTSTTDNALANLCVGGAASCIVASVANPLYVLRSRVQVMHVPSGTRFPSFWVLKDLLKHEGPRGLLRGLHVNVLLAIMEGSVFAGTYEGTKYFADVSDA